MTTTTYLRNAAEIRVAAEVLKEAGFNVTQKSIRENDRYVLNIVARLGANAQVERAIVEAVKAQR